MTQLHLSLHGATIYLSNPWSFGVNVSRAGLLHRKEIQRHLLMGRDELGFRHVRFGYVFDEEMKTLQPDGSCDFTHLEVAIDWLMEQGFAPFISLSGVPQSLRAENSVLPADFEKWTELVRSLAAFIDGRYGCDAQEWHFEVWPGADDNSAWPSTREDYFRLYDLSAKAVKSVNTQLKVGGPAGHSQDWLEAFVDHVNAPSETYGLEVQRCNFVTVSQSADLPAIRSKVTSVLGESTPMILASYAPEPTGGTTAHADGFAGGAGVLASIAAVAEHVSGALYACMSDVDAIDPPFEPFHGGPGLVTVNDIRKPAFNVLKLLNEHIGYKSDWHWIEPADGLVALVSQDYHNVIRVLAAYHKNDATGPGRFTLVGLPESVQWGQVQVIRAGFGSPLEAWNELGHPRFVNRSILEVLESAAHPATTEVNFKDFPPRLEPGMTLQITIPIPDDVANANRD